MLAAVLCNVCSAEPSAADLYKIGRKYEKRKDYPNAYLYYSMAAAKDPAKQEYWLRAQALQRRAVEKAGVMPAGAGASETVTKSDPLETAGPAIPEADEKDLRDARKPQPPVEIQASAAEHDFDLRGDYKQLWEQVAEAYGLKVVFDGDYDTALKTISFRLTAADYRNALNALSLATGSFFVPISPQLMMVVKDSEQKRKEVENTVVLEVPIPDPVTVQEAQELARSVQQVMEIQRFAIDSVHRVAIMRDRVSKVRPAQMLFQELLYARCQVSIEVELLAWSRSRTRQLGTNLPTSWTLTPSPSTITLAGGPLMWALSIGSATIVAKAAEAEARILYDAEIRSVSGEKASLLVGQKYPIQSMGYIGVVPSGAQTYTPPPNFTFEDLGFSIKLTPRVHDRNELTLDIDSEVKLLAGGSLNGIPVVSNRKFAAQVRLRFDEVALISGLVAHGDIRTMSGYPGLINVPVLSAALGNVTKDLEDGEILLLLKPTLLSLPSSELVTHQIWLGSETRPRMPM